MLADLAAAVACARGTPSGSPSSDVRAVVLRSSVPGVFCAGADLKERASMTPEQVSSFVEAIRSTFSAVAALPMPTIAVVEGAALGGGTELALACDFRVAGEGASFGLPETTLAIIPGAGGTQRLPRLIGAARAKELILTGRRIPAAQAERVGLLTSLVKAGEADAAALALARELGSNGPVAVRAAKEAIDSGMEVGLSEALGRVEKASYARVIPTADRLEGLAAFREKRKPVYTGK
jgi:methylglutaconyl-CoA hydratase